MSAKLTRNFCIIAHVDHGKTTLSDRLLEYTSTITKRNMTDQHLDSMDLEKERGITIKMHPVVMNYPAKDGKTYKLHLTDTPGHVDFAYEVSRSLAACEGALLLIDAAQGVEAQTVANAHLAEQQGLKIIPVINKIDLPSANLELCMRQLEDILTIPAEEAILASGKSGIGIQDILEAVVTRIPAPRWTDYPTLRALVFDSKYDAYRGVISYVRVFSGTIKAGEMMSLMSTGQRSEVKEVGVFRPGMEKIATLGAGDVGYVISSIKSTDDIKIGDTITHANKPAEEMLPGYKEVRPMVYCGLYPLESDDYEKLKVALGKLRLNDSALIYSSESSVALGFGFRCGFLGLLHMEIVQERLEREFDQDLITTAPTVVYEVLMRDGTTIQVENPAKLPEVQKMEEIREPIITTKIFVPQEYLGAVITLCESKRGSQVNMAYHGRQVQLTYDMPMAEVVMDFFDKLKSVSRGYASLDYEFKEYRAADVVKLDVLINGDKVDALSLIVHRANAPYRGRELAAKMRELIPRQMYDVAIQAAIGSTIVARENVKAMRKDVLAKCYGGDITRKKKLLEKQKAGKKRMKQVGSVEIPQEAFLAVLRVGDK